MECSKSLWMCASCSGKINFKISRNFWNIKYINQFHEFFQIEYLFQDGHSSCIFGDAMYIFGGYEEAAEPFRPDVYKLDLNLFEWTLLKCKGEPPLYRDFHTATAIGDKMFIFGGRSDKTANGNNDHHHFNHFPGLIAGHEYYSDKLVYLVSIPDIYLTIFFVFWSKLLIGCFSAGSTNQKSLKK